MTIIFNDDISVICKDNLYKNTEWITGKVVSLEIKEEDKYVILENNNIKKLIRIGKPSPDCKKLFNEIQIRKVIKVAGIILLNENNECYLNVNYYEIVEKESI
jgi:putative aminomethyltransferase